MSTLFTALNGLASIVALICFIMVIIAMFKSGDQTMGIVCLVTLLLCGLGVLIAFIMGWVNAGKWNVKQVMLIWTAAIVAGFVFGALGAMNAPAMQGVPALGG